MKLPVLKTQAIMPAAGLGTRLQAAVPKPFVLLDGEPIFIHTLKVLAECPGIESIVVVAPPDHLSRFEETIQRCHFQKTVKVVGGGATRTESVFNGLAAVDADTEMVVIHDGARPLIKLSVIEEAVKLCRESGAVVVAVPVKPTIKKVHPASLLVEETLNREELWEAQTPQVFKKEILMKAYEEHGEDPATDDAGLVERLGREVKILRGDYDNIKITTQEDLLIAEVLLKARRG
ncbi:MAG TPA: 2-C-methyl-D-erythritol 4-phosphate cytidylyltransferase [Candidatus Omnitrophica bacterium]|nr:MAG: 2-C-methyl-D-erythritol 4-phosphate cytidylyltransferase [Omnitrophica WOR_2 bacterium GWA2_45_18]HBR14900.1 2-C-methyl-D-erythritol 4-phosphate cytidylyltransferase [Candidatus Omnitrophota bacterium]